MSEALSTTLSAPGLRAKIEELGADAVAGGPERARRFLDGEAGKWGRVIRGNNITAESRAEAEPGRVARPGLRPISPAWRRA